MSDKPELLDVTEAVGKILGSLVVVNIWQTKAIMDLANAIKKDKNLSDDTREIANITLSTVDRVIEKLDTLTGEEASSMMKAYFGARDE